MLPKGQAIFFRELHMGNLPQLSVPSCLFTHAHPYMHVRIDQTSQEGILDMFVHAVVLLI